jgi:hypothetical protein
MVAGRGRVGVLVSAVMLSVSVLVVGSSAGVVSAAVEPVDGVITETGEALDVAGGLVADAAPLVESGDGFVAQVAGNEVEIPVDAADPLVLDGVSGEVAVELPVVPGVGDGVVDESGAVVFESEVSPVSLAAQATDDGGLQVLVVIDDATAPTEYRFDMTVPAGAVLLPLTDGGAVVVDAVGVVVSVVAPAWAIDAHGQPVPTHYEVEGTTLVQVIDHHGATYPVVGDPCWKCIVGGIAGAVAVAAVGGAVCALTAGAGCVAVAASVSVGFGVGVGKVVNGGKKSELIKQPACFGLGAVRPTAIGLGAGVICATNG